MYHKMCLKWALKRLSITKTTSQPPLPPSTHLSITLTVKQGRKICSPFSLHVIYFNGDKWCLFVTVTKYGNEYTNTCIKHKPHTHKVHVNTPTHTHAQCAPVFIHHYYAKTHICPASSMSLEAIVFPSPRRFQSESCVNTADIWSHEQNMNRAYVKSRQTEAGAHSSVTRMNGHH